MVGPLLALAALVAESAPQHGRAAAAAAAVVPGVLVHGAGHYVEGDRRTAVRLLAIEGMGAGGLAVGFSGLFLTGAARGMVGVFAATVVAGGALFVLPALADLYGVLAPEGGTGAALPTTAVIDARMGLRQVYDPTLSYGTLVGAELDLRWRGLRVSPFTWRAVDGDNRRVGGLAAWRFVGARPGMPAADGSALEIEGGVVDHRYAVERFALTTVEASLRGRLDLQRVAPSLAGSFADGQLGLGIGITRYLDVDVQDDSDTLLLARFGFGVYLGRGPARAGEVQAYYDHRHDGYAGGLKLPGIGSGAAGHFGLEGTFFFTERWGVRAEAQAGSAYLGGLALAWRTGGLAR